MDLDSPWLWAGIAALLVLLGAALYRRIARWHDGFARRRRAAHAQRSERLAERLLKRAGYRIVDRQVTAEWQMHVEGRPVQVRCRADLLIKKGRKRLIAEVKSGSVGADPTHPATRRQLLEYARAFQVDAVVLVDMVHERILRVDFDD